MSRKFRRFLYVGLALFLYCIVALAHSKGQVSVLQKKSFDDGFPDEGNHQQQVNTEFKGTRRELLISCSSLSPLKSGICTRLSLPHGRLSNE